MAKAPEDLVLISRAIYTMDPARPRVNALALSGGRIAAAGSEAEAASHAGPRARRVDLGGRMVLPGLVDSHIHLVWYGETLGQVALDGAHSLRQALARIARQAAQTPVRSWLVGHGWNRNAWPRQDAPSRQALDPLSGDHPAFLCSKDGHAAWVNSRSLQLAGITGRTPDPAGGVVERDAKGEPTGILKDAAVEIVRRLIPPPSAADRERAARRAIDALHRFGVTGAHAPEDFAARRACESLRDAGELNLRLLAMIPLDRLSDAIAAGMKSGAGDEWVQTGPVKIFSDGSLGSQTAALLAPYAGGAQTGLRLVWGEELRHAILRAAQHGLAAAVHAIGDAANREALDAFAWAADRLPKGEPAGGAPGKPPLRHRIEHAQLLTPAELRRFAAQGIIASMQPLHCPSDRYAADRFWGERSRYAYAFRSLLAHGAALAFGSDAPIESPDPRLGLHGALWRRRVEEPLSQPWYPEEAITLDEALAAYTRGAAWAAGQEDVSGRLAPGLRADLTIFESDLYGVEPEQIPTVDLFATIVGGRVAHGEL